MVCKKHNKEMTNFWSNFKGGVIYGCVDCDNLLRKDSLKERINLNYKEDIGF